MPDKETARETAKEVAKEAAKETFQEWLDRRILDGEEPDPVSLCQDAPGLLPDLLQLIQQYRAVDEALPSPTRPERPERRGREEETREAPVIARYRVGEQIGEGGMGEVWEAQQEEPIRRSVALKVIKRGLGLERVVLRFESERQALAAMEHPAIAKVFDAGATDDGRPYFAMELVRGLPITRFCDENRLSVHQRLELFARVCDGVQHAHQKGLIHRDLKPSNVLVMLVDESPQAKIIDFGIAKAIVPDRSEHGTLTELGQVVGTPAYMSPEQANLTNPDIDTRSDVYSLGVMLYELMVGVRPFETGATPFSPRARTLDPPTPSARVTALGSRGEEVAALRRTKSTSLARSLRGDLDWITLKSLEEDPEKRYSSPAAIAEDLRRHFRDEPVLAGPSGARYRLGKLIRRHRVAVAAGVLVLLALVSTLAGLAVGLDRALRAERRATVESAASRSVADFLIELFEHSDPTSEHDGALSARDLLDRGADRIQTELGDQPLVQARMLETMGRAYKGLGLYDTADELLLSSIQLWRAEAGEESLDLARTLYQFADLKMNLGDPAAAEEAGQAAAAIRRQHLPENSLENAVSNNQLGLIRWRMGEHDQALERLETALAIKEEILGPDHGDLASLLNNVAILHWEAYDFEAARTLMERGLAIFERELGPQHPNVASNLNNLALVSDHAKRFDESVAYHQRALEIREETLEPDHPDIAETLNNLSSPLMALQRYDEARTALERALVIREKVFGTEHAEFGTTLFNLGNLLVQIDQFETARPFVEQAQATFETALGQDHPSIAYAHFALAEIESSEGRWSQAYEQVQRCIGIRERALGAQHPLLLEPLELAGSVLRELDRDEEADAMLHRAGGIRQKRTHEE